MRILQQSDAVASLVLGEQQICYSKNYRLSPFVLSLKLDNDILFFNNLTKKYIVITNDELEGLCIQYKLEEDSVIFNDFSYKQSEITDLFIKDYFFVPCDMDMVKVRDNLRSTALLLRKADNDIYSYVIFTTTACNARCFYCFEAGIEVQTMSPKTAEDLAEYILKHSGNKRIFLRWFGGEPLCNMQAIDIICKTLTENGRNFRSDIITNGYLLDKDIIKKTKTDWSMYSFQITLDGRREVYNRVKNYKNEDPKAYDRVIQNIQDILENDMHVEIRLNMDLYNADELEALVHELAPQFMKYKNLNIYARPLFENVRSCENSHNVEERKEITARFLELESIISSYGMQRMANLDKDIKLYSCMADEPYTYIVSPNGKFGYCEHYPLERHFGSIWDDKPRGTFSDYAIPLNKCSECVAYPTCLRLIDCHDGRNECFEYEQMMRVGSIKNGMIKLYNKSLNNG